MQGKIFLPPEIRRDVPRIILSGGEELLLEQHGGLFSYDSKCIRIRTGAGLLTVEGEKLVIEYFGVQDLMIRGKIHALRMDESIK
ncbi:MAG: YabP/YqfC family sporulation protein [Clostridia bacterium]|nr:sporulation protein [Clostridiales bacterium]MBQ2977734.1 YabP/YqfC family sporulation protein [Clostridia bacterium]MDD6684116.1 YabP/YqfC family sporulation protein [Clostridiales bacterium]